MRPIERIEPFLEKVLIRITIDHIWKLPNIDSVYIKELFEKNKDKLKEIWLENPDLRFSQVLVNMKIIPNIPGGWYCWEESEILIELGFSPEDVYYWGIYYDKDMKPLEHPTWKPISELNSDHLRAIINGGFVSRNKLYRQTMLKVLRKRGERL